MLIEIAMFEVYDCKKTDISISEHKDFGLASELVCIDQGSDNHK